MVAAYALAEAEPPQHMQRSLNPMVLSDRPPSTLLRTWSKLGIGRSSNVTFYLSAAHGACRYGSVYWKSLGTMATERLRYIPMKVLIGSDLM